MKPLRLLALLFCVSLPLSAAPVRADTADAAQADALAKDREALARHMAGVTLSILQDQKKDFADRQATMERGIASMVDINWIARFTLGSAWKSATDAQRERYTDLYGQYLTKMYISNFAQSKERKIKDIRILGIADSEDNTFIARTEVVLYPAGNLHVDYLVQEKEGSRKIVDIVLEGVSLLAAHRAEFGKMAATEGVDSVIARLETLVKAGVPPMSVSMQSGATHQAD